MRKSPAVLAVVIALAWAVPASADHSDAGCHAYGTLVSGFAQAGIVGGTVSGIATSGAGAVPDVVTFLKLTTC